MYHLGEVSDMKYTYMDSAIRETEFAMTSDQVVALLPLSFDATHPSTNGEVQQRNFRQSVQVDCGHSIIGPVQRSSQFLFPEITRWGAKSHLKEP